MNVAVIHCEIISVNEEGVMSSHDVKKWEQDFNPERMKIDKEDRRTQPSVAIDSLAQKIEENLLSDLRLTIDDIHELSRFYKLLFTTS